MLLATFCIASTRVDNAHALGLDEISQQSGLGQPLRLVIPLITNASDEIAGEDFAGECFKVIPASATDLPQLSLPRVALEHRGGRAFVVVSTAYPITEPALRVAVQAGCRVSLSREYTVLLDPVVIEPPVVEATMNVPIVEPAASASIEPSAPAAAAAPPEARPIQRPAVPKKRVASAAPTKPSSASKGGSQVVAAPTPQIERRAAKATNRPRLQVSRSIGDATAIPVTPGAAPTAAAEREALHALEEETVALQRRIAELSLTMERMQQELQAAKAARDQAELAARAARERAAAPAAPSAPQSWIEGNGLMLVLLALIGLIAVLLLNRQRRKPVLIPAPITAAQQDAFNPMDLGEPSVPRFPATGAEEMALGRKTVDDTQPNVVRHFAPAAPLPEIRYDPELAFDYEVVKTAEEHAAYSTLEREQPGIVAKLTSAWFTPEAAVRLEHYILTPGRGGKPLSREAIAELKLLHTIALDHAAGYGGGDATSGRA